MVLFMLALHVRIQLKDTWDSSTVAKDALSHVYTGSWLKHPAAPHPGKKKPTVYVSWHVSYAHSLRLPFLEHLLTPKCPNISPQALAFCLLTAPLQQPGRATPAIAPALMGWCRSLGRCTCSSCLPPCRFGGGDAGKSSSLPPSSQSTLPKGSIWKLL